MKLREAIEERKGQMAKIGSGCGFVYCGEITDELCELLEKLSENEIAKSKDRLKKLEMHLSRFDHIWAQKLENQMDEFYRTVHSKKMPIDMVEQKHKKLLEKYEKEKVVDLRTTQKGISQINKMLDEWTAFPEREVKEIYPSLEQGEIIIFKGQESGKYWMYEEYEEGNR